MAQAAAIEAMFASCAPMPRTKPIPTPRASQEDIALYKRAQSKRFAALCRMSIEWQNSQVRQAIRERMRQERRAEKATAADLAVSLR